ncbi:MAG: hypothetical protein JW950_08690, partial [Deltaproteobacteria bacterium]|nr:hypothetical protein [Deltaproteobacteria bacterium]
MPGGAPRSKKSTPTPSLPHRGRGIQDGGIFLPGSSDTVCGAIPVKRADERFSTACSRKEAMMKIKANGIEMSYELSGQGKT